MISNISDSYQQNIQTEMNFQFNSILFIYCSKPQQRSPRCLSHRDPTIGRAAESEHRQRYIAFLKSYKNIIILYYS